MSLLTLVKTVGRKLNSIVRKFVGNCWQARLVRPILRSMEPTNAYQAPQLDPPRPTRVRYMVLGYLPFYGLVALDAIKARRGEHRSADQGGYRMPLYPWPVVLMLLYVACGLASGFAGDPFAACGGIGILIAGVLAYEGFRRRKA